MPLEKPTDEDLFDGLVSRRHAAPAAESSRPPARAPGIELGGIPRVPNPNGRGDLRVPQAAILFPVSELTPEDDDGSDDEVTVMVPAAQFQERAGNGHVAAVARGLDVSEDAPTGQHRFPGQASPSARMPSFEVEVEVEEIEPEEITAVGNPDQSAGKIPAFGAPSSLPTYAEARYGKLPAFGQLPPSAKGPQSGLPLPPQPPRSTVAGLGAYVPANAGPGNGLPSFEEAQATQGNGWTPALAPPPARTGFTLAGPPNPFSTTREPPPPASDVLSSTLPGLPAIQRVPSPIRNVSAPPPVSARGAAPNTRYAPPAPLTAAPPPPPPPAIASPGAGAPFGHAGVPIHSATTPMIPPPPVGRVNGAVSVVPPPAPERRLSAGAPGRHAQADRTGPSTMPLVVTNLGGGTIDDTEPEWHARRKGKRMWATAALAAALIGGAGFVAMNAKIPFLASEVEATLKATAKQPGVRLRLDGKEVGVLPLAIKNITPGEHSLEFSIDDHYSTEKQKVSVGPNEIRELAPVALRVVRGIATFDVRSEGASLTLVTGDERRPISDLSRPLELDATRPAAIEIAKPGFQTVREPLTFDESAHKVFVVELGPKDTSVPVRPERLAPAPDPAPVIGGGGRTPALRAPSRTEPAPRAQSAPKAESPGKSDGPPGTCTVNFNSLPPSNVAVDGRPVGPTPKMGVIVPAGSHNVIFAGPDETRRASFTCTAGSQKTVTVRM